MLVKLSLFLFLYVVPQKIDGHTYHLGGDCAAVEPLPGFIMDKFVGKWYAIQKTSTASRCMVYNFQKTEYRLRYKVQQLSENPVIGMVKDNTYKYTGNLEIIDESEPANMVVKFPLNVAGKSSFVVFITDYDNYAGIYTCQQIGFTHRHSATVLSRKTTLDKTYIDKIRNRLSNFNVNPFDLNSVNQTSCVFTDDKFTIDINDTTFSKENIQKTLKNVGSAIGDGVDFLWKGAKKVYESVKKDDKETKHNYKEIEETTQGHHVYFEPNAELL
ncbi:hypothetical protein PGB90_004792 [Kerria lacca]